MYGPAKDGNIRSDRENTRVCPSKLSKRELEDLYYTVLDSNVELKKTINSNQDRIRVLSTKLQRVSAAKRVTQASKDSKDCCSSAKAVIEEQNEHIQDLERANKSLSEKVKMMNMKLSSAKQFLRRNSPNQAAKVFGRDSTKKSTTSLNSKKTEMCCVVATVSCQCTADDLVMNGTDTTATNSNKLDEVPVKLCNENKCTTQMDGLKLKIVSLEQELSTAHEEYSARISRLEALVVDLQGENRRAAAEAAVSQQSLSDKGREITTVKDRARELQGECCDLKTELSIEKKKVTELETQLKCGERSRALGRAVGYTLQARSPTSSTPKKKSSPPPTLLNYNSPGQFIKKKDESSSMLDKPPAQSDDSGYNDPNRSCLSEPDKTFHDSKENTTLNSDEKQIVKVNKELMKKITELQTQLNSWQLPVTSTKEDTDTKYNRSYDIEINDDDVPQMKNVKDYKGVIVDPKKKVAEVEKTLIEVVEEKIELDDRLGGDEDAKKNEVVQKNTRIIIRDSYLPTDDNKIETNDKDEVATSQAQEVPNASVNEEKDRLKNTDASPFHQIPGPCPVDTRKPNEKSEIVKKNKNNLNADKKDLVVANGQRTRKFSLVSKVTAVSETADNRKTGKTDGKSVELKQIPEMENAETPHSSAQAKNKNECGIKRVSIPLRDSKRDEEVETDEPPKATQEIQTDKLNDITYNYKKRISIASTNHTRIDNSPTMSLRIPKGNFAVDLTKTEDSRVDKADKKSTDQEVEDKFDDKRRNSVDRRFGTEKTGVSVGEEKRDAETGTDDNQLGTQPVPVKSELTYSIPTSPDVAKCHDTSADTDKDVSSITDLSERGTSSRPSAGEEMIRRRRSNSTCTPDVTELSEGEVPSRVRKLSIGERPVEYSNANKNDNKDMMQLTSSQRLEATLQEISAELRRCTRLLLQTNRQEVIY